MRIDRERESVVVVSLLVRVRAESIGYGSGRGNGEILVPQAFDVNEFICKSSLELARPDGETYSLGQGWIETS